MWDKERKFDSLYRCCWSLSGFDFLEMEGGMMICMLWIPITLQLLRGREWQFTFG